MDDPIALLAVRLLNQVDMPAFRTALIEWGQRHARTFPWRQTHDPYRLLCAEVMLHRTQARQVVPVYEEFMHRFPEVQSLAAADNEELRHVLYSLGLRWRVDLLQAMAEQLVARFSGTIPRVKEELLTLPGVSDYIASAVRCFAWNEAEALVDTNTVRVVGRIFGLTIKESSRRNRLFRSLIAALVDPCNARAYNFALLDLADQVCTSKHAPLCTACPLVHQCAHGRWC